MSIIKIMHFEAMEKIAHATHNTRFSFPAPLCRLCEEEMRIARLDHSDGEELEVTDYE